MQTLRLDKCQMEKEMRAEVDGGQLTTVEVHPLWSFQEVEIDLPSSSKVFLETGAYDWATEKARTLEVPLHAVRIVTASTFSTKLKKNWRRSKCALRSRFGNNRR